MSQRFEENNPENRFQIPIEHLYKKFESFIDVENNHRIFFSGKFGVGKTFFLQKFFGESESKYNSYYLNPVNYQIHKNEDIIDLIKVDILNNLIQKDPEIFENNEEIDFIDSRNLIYLWGRENCLELASSFVNYIPKLGKPMSQTINLTQKFMKFRQKVVDEDSIRRHLETLKNTDLTETDQVSKLIKEKVVSSKKDRKKSVLVIDDLDRVDPEHIFRILNVFSAYTDNSENNKFGFDRIILVGDEHNIRTIFKHKYGQGADFEGYFDKFYTLYIYEFLNKKDIIENLDQILRGYQSGNYELKNAAFHPSGHIKIFLAEVLGSALKSDLAKVNLRSILKGINYKLPAYDEHAVPQTGLDFKLETMDTSIKALIQILGGSKSRIIEVLSYAKDTRSSERLEGFMRMFTISMINNIGDLSSNYPLLERETDYLGHKVTFKNFEDANHPFEVRNVREFFYDVLIYYIEEDFAFLS